jgi:hypothetical protein
MILQNLVMDDMAIAMKRDEMAVANPAPSIHINGMPLDIGAHDMTERMTGMTSSNPGFKLSVANDMEVIEPVAVRSLSHNQCISDHLIRFTESWYG